MKSRIDAWRKALAHKSFGLQFALTGLAMWFILRQFLTFLMWNEKRPGVTLADPFLATFTAVDLSLMIFCLGYSVLLFTLFQLLAAPKRLLMFCQTYSLMILFRVGMMWLAPFDPPVGMIPLVDPFALFFLGTAETLNKDLFFSGHFGLLFLLFLMNDDGWKKRVVGVAAVLIGSGVLLQKAHYTIDVVVAGFVVFASYSAVNYVHQKFAQR